MRQQFLGESPLSPCWELCLDNHDQSQDSQAATSPGGKDTLTNSLILDASLLPLPPSELSLEGIKAARIGGYMLPRLSLIQDWETVSNIIISNYQSILALPFITEYTGFRGRVFATDATLAFAK
jgi:hypothetical protein